MKKVFRAIKSFISSLLRVFIKPKKILGISLAPLIIVFVVILQMSGPLFFVGYRAMTAHKYTYLSERDTLTGKDLPKLASLLKEDSEKQAFILNSEEIVDETSKPLDIIRQSVVSEDTDKPQYAAEIGKFKPTVKVYDSQLDLSFSSELLLKTQVGRLDGSKVLYPTPDSNIGVVYSAKNNGIKEDIIINEAPQDELTFTYKINLPDSLVAKMLEDGSLGVFSADPSLFSNVSFGSEADRQLIENVKKNGDKTHLAFVIPKPTIVAESGQIGNAFASFKFNSSDSTLDVIARGLKSIEGVFSIDPTTVITSTSDFATGNDEGNIDYNTSNAINTLGVSGGAMGTWSNANTGGNMGGARVGQAVAVYKGFIYAAGGWTGSTQTRVDFGTLNSSGSVTSWTNTTALPATRSAAKAVAYNNYLYVIGGCNDYTDYGAPYYNNCTPGNHDAGGGGGWMRSVVYAPINSDGTLGSWTTDTDYFTNAREHHAAGVYNGRLYIAGGRIASHPNASDLVNDVQYAPINTDGSIGAWTTDSGTSFANVRMYFNMEIYNGYMYLIGGYNEETDDFYMDVQYAPINEDGSIGTWATTTSLANDVRFGASTVIHRGYLYAASGADWSYGTYSTIEYAPINSDGSLGDWVGASNDTPITEGWAGHENVDLVAWGDSLIFLWGNYATNYCYKATIFSNGAVSDDYGSWSTTNTLYRYATFPVAHNGNIYYTGGANTSDVVQSSTGRAAVNSDGTLGTWTTTGNGTLNTARQGHGTAIYNGYIYVIGGSDTSYVPLSKSNAVEYAAINADGTLGTWTADSTGLMNQERAWTKAVAYNGYMYALGGQNTAGTDLSSVEYAPINSDGTLGTWTVDTGDFTNARSSPTAFAYNGYMYIAGGDVYSSNIVRGDVQYAPINSDGTLGTWTATTSLPSNRTAHTMVAVDGIVYLAGGCTAFSSGCTTYTNSVYSAPINTNGTLGSFTAFQSVTNSKWGHGMVAYNNYLYILNGANGGTKYTTTEFLRINAGGSGGAVSWTSSANSLGTATTKHASIAYNGYLYTLGGCTAYTSSNCTTFSSSVQYASITDGGRPGTSSTTTAFTTARYGHAVAVKDGYMYILGGCSASTGGTCTNYLSDTQFAKINSDGTLSAWTAGPSFTTARHSLSATVSGNYIYLAGGNSGSVRSDVQYAAFTGGGGMSSWASTSSLNTSRRDLALVSNNGYLYVLGGHDGTNILRSVEYVVVNSNGTVGTWAQTTPIPVPLFGHTANVYNGRIYVAGGCSAGACSTYNNKVHQVEIHGNGHIRNIWETSIPTFTTARTESGSALYKGILYVTGGCSAGTCTTIQSNISYTGLNIIPYTSEYSRIIDVGSGGRSIKNFNYTSTGTGTVNVYYRSACTTTTLTSNRALLAYDLSSTEDVGFVDLSARYIQLYLQMDSSYNRTYPSGSHLQVQDMTVAYTAANPDPSEQMRLGNAFIDEVEVGFGARPEGTSSLSCL